MAGDQLNVAKRDPRVADHLEWIGFVRPTGLVVSASALVSAGVILNRRDAAGQRLLRECLVDGTVDVGSPVAAVPSTVAAPALRDFRTFATTVLGWNFSPKGYAGTEDAPIPVELEVRLPDSGGVIRPDFAVRMEPVRSVATSDGAGVLPGDSPSVGSANQVRDAESVQSKPGSDQASPWQLLVMACETSQPFDHAGRRAGGDLSPHSRMERLLRETGVSAGLLYNGEALRLISAPKGESSGWLDFRVADMLQTAGRPISSAMRELLGQTRLLSVGRNQRLAALLVHLQSNNAVC